MKKFLLHIVCFILPLLIMAYPADRFLSNYLKQSHPPSDEYAVWNAIYAGKINAEILVYGSSTAWVQVNPQTLADSLQRTVYNLGIDGHNFHMQYLRHKLLLKQNPPPKLIIQTLDVLTLQKRRDLFNQEQFLPYMLFNNELKNATTGYEGYLPVDFQVPLVRYYGKRNAMKAAIEVAILAKPAAPNRVLGFQAQNKIWNSDFSSAKASLKNYHAQLDSTTICLFERFIQECRARHIDLVFLYSPEFIDGQQFIRNRKEVVSLYEKLSQKYNVPFYNYSADEMTRNRSNYYNGLHLNKQGSMLLTNKLIHDLKLQPGLKVASR